MAELSLESSAPAPARRRMPAQLKAGLVIVGSIVLLSLLAPWIAPHPWDTISIRTRFQPPSLTYWFGTDDYGRDVLSRLLMGGRLSLAMGIGATLISVLFGVPVGLAAGYFGGKVDEVLMRVADVLMAIPAIMLGLLVLAVTPPALWKTAVAVGFVYVPLIARVARSVTLGLANVEFVEAGSLAEARERLREGGLDAALIDVRLPDGDGLDLVRELSNGNATRVNKPRARRS